MLQKQASKKRQSLVFFSDNPNGLSALLRDEDAHAPPRTHAFDYGKTPLDVQKKKENTYENLQRNFSTQATLSS